MHPERKPRIKVVLEGVFGVWTAFSTPRLPWSPWYAPPALAASQRWVRSSKVLPKTTGCHQGRQFIQAACEQLFISTDGCVGLFMDAQQTSALYLVLKADLNDPNCQKQLFQVETRP